MVLEAHGDDDGDSLINYQDFIHKMFAKWIKILYLKFLFYKNYFDFQFTDMK